MPDWIDGDGRGVLESTASQAQYIKHEPNCKEQRERRKKHIQEQNGTKDDKTRIICTDMNGKGHKYTQQATNREQKRKGKGKIVYECDCSSSSS